MVIHKKPLRPKWRRRPPVNRRPAEREFAPRPRKRSLGGLVLRYVVTQHLLSATLPTLCLCSTIAMASAAERGAVGIASPAEPASAMVAAAPAHHDVTLFDERRRPASVFARLPRAPRRTKAEIEREQRELLEATQREVDAIVAEFHNRLPRAAAKRIGMIYARYSTKLQSSVPAQVRAMYEAAVREGTFVPRELVFFDLAVKGYRDNRPGLNGLKEALAGKRGSSLLVFGTNRLFRKAHRAVRFVEEEIVEQGIRCYFLQQNLDTAANKDWRMHLMIQAAIDENGTSMYAENIRAAHQGQFLRMEVVGTLALGYGGEPIEGAPPTRRGRPRCRVVVAQEEAKYVLQIFEWYVEKDKAMDEIAQFLNDDSQAPSPPKSLHGLWTHATVRGVLTNARYRGYWEYGRFKVTYQSKKDYARQVEREQPLQAAHVESLRIISDKTWYDAQARLLKERGNRGRKPKNPDGCAHPKMLNGMLWCPEHDRPLYVGAANGTAMICLLCKVVKQEARPLYSQLDRELALRLTMDKLADLIRGDEQLIATAVEACRTATEALQRPDPERVEQLKAQVATKTRAILTNLRNPGATEEDQKESDAIVADLRAERTRLQAELACLETARNRRATLPDEAEIRRLVDDLEAKLMATVHEGSSGDRRAVRRLIESLTGGRIILYQQGERKAKRGWLQGRFRVRLLSWLVEQATGESAGLTEEGVEVTVDYREPSTIEVRADEAWHLQDQGLLNKEIAERLKCSRNFVAKLLKQAAASRGLPCPDGRRRRDSPVPKRRVPAKYVRMAGEVGKLADEGMHLAEIGRCLKLDRTTLTKSYNLDRQQRGLPPLDGRSRRKLL